MGGTSVTADGRNHPSESQREVTFLFVSLTPPPRFNHLYPKARPFKSQGPLILCLDKEPNTAMGFTRPFE